MSRMTALAALDPTGIEPFAVADRSPRLLTSEIVSGGTSGTYARVPSVLGIAVDDAARKFGVKLYDAMLTDPAVFRAVSVLVRGALADGLTITPAISIDPDAPEEAAQGLDADAKLAREIADHCTRTVAAMKDPIGRVLRELGLFALGTGHKLGEKVYEVPEDGPDAAKLLVARIKPKPRTSWRFVVDNRMNLLGILSTFGDASDPDPSAAGRWAVYPAEKFVVATWDIRDGDPRGNPASRPSYNAWNLKQQDWPEYFRYVAQFGTGKLIVTLGPTMRTDYETDPVTGRPDLTKPIPPTKDMAKKAQAFIEGSFMILPVGSTAQMIYPQGSGESHQRFIDTLNREIVGGILGSDRATEQSKFGSQADSSTAQDYVGNVIRDVKNWFGDLVSHQLFRPQILLNYGEDAARRLTPAASFGTTEHQDFASVAAALASLINAGGLARNQIGPALRKLLSLELPDPIWADPAAAANPGVGDGNQPGGGTREPGKPARGGAPAASMRALATADRWMRRIAV
jgi:hypothetical protein